MSLPKALAFPQLKSSAVAAVSSVVACKPVSGVTFSPGDVMRFDIIGSGSRATFLDTSGSWMCMDVTVGATTAGPVQFTAMDLIQKLELFSSAGSQQIESIQNYAALNVILRDLCSDRSCWTKDSICLHTDPGRLRGGRSGTTTGSSPYYYSVRVGIPLISIIGTLSAQKTYLPLHALNAPLRLEITLNPTAGALCVPTGASTNGISYQVTNASFVECLTVISDIAMSQISSLTGGVYAWHTQIWRNYRNTIPVGSTNASLLIPARFDSCRSLITIMRQFTNDVNHPCNTARPKYHLSSFQHRLNANFCDPKPVNTLTSTNALEAFMAAKRLFSDVTSEERPTLLSVWDFAADSEGTCPVTSTSAVLPSTTNVTSNVCTLANVSSYTSIYTASAPEYPSFMICLDAQPFAGPANNNLISGSSSLAGNWFLDLQFDTAIGANLTTDTYVEADCLMTIDASTGSLSVKF